MLADALVEPSTYRFIMGLRSISSSGTPVGTKFIASYVGKVVE